MQLQFQELSQHCIIISMVRLFINESILCLNG